MINVLYAISCIYLCICTCPTPSASSNRGDMFSTGFHTLDRLVEMSKLISAALLCALGAPRYGSFCRTRCCLHYFNRVNAALQLAIEERTQIQSPGVSRSKEPHGFAMINPCILSRYLKRFPWRPPIRRVSTPCTRLARSAPNLLIT